MNISEAIGKWSCQLWAEKSNLVLILRINGAILLMLIILISVTRKHTEQEGEKNKYRTSQRHRKVLSAESETEIGFMKWIKPINMIASLEAPRSLDEERSCIIKIQILDIASETIISQGFIWGTDLQLKTLRRTKTCMKDTVQNNALFSTMRVSSSLSVK